MNDPAMGGGIIAPTGAVTEAVPAPSRIDEIRARQVERSAALLDLRPSVWGGDVVLRCKRVSAEQLRQSAMVKSQWASNAELLVIACTGAFITDGKGGLTPVGEGAVPPVKLDGRLADLLGLPGDDPRAICRALYGNDVELALDAKNLIDWTTGVDLKADLDDLPEI